MLFAVLWGRTFFLGKTLYLFKTCDDAFFAGCARDGSPS